MGIETLIARGIGFAPGNTRFVPTHGLTPFAAINLARLHVFQGTGRSPYSDIGRNYAGENDRVFEEDQP